MKYLIFGFGICIVIAYCITFLVFDWNNKDKLIKSITSKKMILYEDQIALEGLGYGHICRDTFVWDISVLNKLPYKNLKVLDFNLTKNKLEQQTKNITWNELG